MLPREIRRGFFQKDVLRLELADAAFQFPDPLVVGISDGRGCPASFFRYALTQNPSVVSLTLSSRATSVIVRGGEESTTFLTACSLN